MQLWGDLLILIVPRWCGKEKLADGDDNDDYQMMMMIIRRWWWLSEKSSSQNVCPHSLLSIMEIRIFLNQILCALSCYFNTIWSSPVSGLTWKRNLKKKKIQNNKCLGWYVYYGWNRAYLRTWVSMWPGQIQFGRFPSVLSLVCITANWLSD